MKKIIFMRHGYLEGKYKDYSKLDFDEFENLLTKKVNPKINKEKTKSFLKYKKCLSDVNFVICSNQNRGIETAQIVNEITGINFESSSLLNEVYFIKGIINQEDIVDFNNLEQILQQKLEGKDKPTISLHADKDVPVEYVVKVMNIAKNNRYRVILATSSK